MPRDDVWPPQPCCYICCTEVNLWSRVIRRRSTSDEEKSSFMIFICQTCYHRKYDRDEDPISPLPIPLSCLFPGYAFKAAFLTVV